MYSIDTIYNITVNKLGGGDDMSSESLLGNGIFILGNKLGGGDDMSSESLVG